VLEELNVKELAVQESAADVERFQIEPRMSLLGPKHKAMAGRIAQAVRSLDPAGVARAVSDGQDVMVSLDGTEYRVAAAEIEVRRQMPAHLAVAQAGGVSLILDTEITPELEAEGWARDTVRHVQQLRKELDLNIEDRIRLRYQTEAPALARAIETWRGYVMAETLALSMEPALVQGAWKAVRIDGAELRIQVARAETP
jgi:isoleucyl-tRNA synthetase